MAKLFFYEPRVQCLLDSGEVNAGGKIYFFDAGTSTPKDTFTDQTLATANANPVVLDSAGRAAVVLNGRYKVRVEDADANVLYTEDNFPPDETGTAGAFNLVTNGSMEDNATGDGKTPDGWTLTEESGSTTTLDSSDQRRGGQSIKFTSTGSGGGNIITTAFFEVTPLRDIDISFLVKSSTAGVRNLVEVLWYDSAQASISTVSIYDEDTVNPTSWALRGAVVTPPSTARYAKLRLYGCHPSDATTGSTWYDDVIVRLATDHALPRGWLSGLGLANGTDSEHDIDIAVGAGRDSADTYDIRLTAALTKQIDAAWTAGDDAGGFPSGLTLSTDTWYHVFVIYNPTTRAVDAGFDTSTSAANLLADADGYTAYRRLGSVLTDGSSNIIGFSQDGDEFLWDTPVNDVALTNPGTSAVLHTLSVPTGVQVQAIISVTLRDSTASSDTAVLVTSPDQADTAPSATGVNDFVVSGTGSVLDTHESVHGRWRTSTSGQVRSRQSTSGANQTLYVTTQGWIDRRAA